MASKDDLKDYGWCSHGCSVKLTPARTVRCPGCGQAICCSCAISNTCAQGKLTEEDEEDDDG